MGISICAFTIVLFFWLPSSYSLDAVLNNFHFCLSASFFTLFNNILTIICSVLLPLIRQLVKYISIIWHIRCRKMFFTHKYAWENVPHQRILQWKKKTIIIWYKIRWIRLVRENKPTEFQNFSSLVILAGCNFLLTWWRTTFFILLSEKSFSTKRLWTGWSCWTYKYACSSSTAF